MDCAHLWSRGSPNLRKFLVKIATTRVSSLHRKRMAKATNESSRATIWYYWENDLTLAHSIDENVKDWTPGDVLKVRFNTRYCREDPFQRSEDWGHPPPTTSPHSTLQLSHTYRNRPRKVWFQHTFAWVSSILFSRMHFRHRKVKKHHNKRCFI